MKASLLTIVCILFCGLSSFAVTAVPLEKMKTFIEKKKPCQLAVAHVALAKDRVTDQCGKEDCVLGASAWCVNDGVIAEGTINEAKGCMLSSYDATMDKLDRVGGRLYIAQNLPCAKGGFEKLMSLPFPFSGPTVKDFLTQPQPGPMPPVLLYSTDPGMVKTYEKLLAEKKKKGL